MTPAQRARAEKLAKENRERASKRMEAFGGISEVTRGITANDLLDWLEKDYLRGYAQAVKDAEGLVEGGEWGDCL